MSEDFFLKKMKGVRPLQNKENIIKNIKPKKRNKVKIDQSDHKNTKAYREKNISEYNISFGEINRDLKRGKIKIDRKLDLHGYSLLDAYEKFNNEVKKNYERNKRCLLVITGKGVHKKGDDEDTPKLFHGKIKNSILSWINNESLKSYILTYQEAGFDHGGDGAIFVYLRKKRD